MMSKKEAEDMLSIYRGKKDNEVFCRHYENGKCKVTHETIQDGSLCTFSNWLECLDFLKHELDVEEYVEK